MNDHLCPVDFNLFAKSLLEKLLPFRYTTAPDFTVSKFIFKSFHISLFNVVHNVLISIAYCDFRAS